MIEDGGGRSREADAEGAESQCAGAGPAGYGQEHADDRGEHDQHYDARFGQLVIVAPARVCFYRRFHSVVRLTDARQLEQMFDVLDHGVRLDLRLEIDDEISKRVDQVIAAGFKIFRLFAV